MTLLDGKNLSSLMLESIKEDVKELSSVGVIPKLAVILVGNDAASQIYVNMKAKACKDVGISSITYEMPENVAQRDLLDSINNLNNDNNLDGILVQLPLPKHINKYEVLECISPFKDIDGFHTHNCGSLYLGLDGFVPATPLGVMTLLKHYKIQIKGANVVIVGASDIVGKPLMSLMLNEGASVSVCHIYTKDIGLYTKNADILCVGVGKRNLITKDLVKNDAVVVDIGINRDGNKIVGDVDFENVSKVASFITPVPGGVGPMTITSLLQNTIKSAKIRANKLASLK